MTIDPYLDPATGVLLNSMGIRQLAAEAGYVLDWSFVGDDENIKAAVDAHRGNLGPLREIIGIVVRRSGIERV